MSFEEAIQHATPFVLFAGAAAGHIIVCIFSHNWWYGSALRRQAMDVVQYLHGLVAVGGPVAFAWFFGFDGSTALHFTSNPLTWFLAAYLVVCWSACFLCLPMITLFRLLRPTPAALIESHSEIVDIAARLGTAPVGQGIQALFAKLPWNEVFQVEFAERTLELPRVPSAWDGLTILHLSDFHFFDTPDRAFYEWVMEYCSENEPDVIALTGDFVDSPKHIEWIKPVFSKLRWRAGAFAILGNHDHWFDTDVIRGELSAVGIQVVSNRWIQLQVRGEPLIVIGNEYPWLRPTPELADCPSEPVRLCLSHTPDNIAWARREQVDLMLSGHVHGGQIRLPVIGSVVVPSQYGRRYDCGTFEAGATVLHVSRGLGEEHPVRFLCRPEVTRLTLKHAIVAQHPDLD